MDTNRSSYNDVDLREIREMRFGPPHLSEKAERKLNREIRKRYARRTRHREAEAFREAIRNGDWDEAQEVG